MFQFREGLSFLGDVLLKGALEVARHKHTKKIKKNINIMLYTMGTLAGSAAIVGMAIAATTAGTFLWPLAVALAGAAGLLGLSALLYKLVTTAKIEKALSTYDKQARTEGSAGMDALFGPVNHSTPAPQDGLSLMEENVSELASRGATMLNAFTQSLRSGARHR